MFKYNQNLYLYDVDAIKQIEVNEAQAKSLLAFLKAENSKLLLDFQALEAKIEDNQKLINQLESRAINGHNGGIPASAIALGKFDSEWSLAKKVEYVVAKSRKAVFAKDIVAKLLALEPDHDDEDDGIRKLSVAVYAALNGKTKNGLLYRVDEGEGFRYGLPAWFDESGELKEDYK